MSHNRAVAPLFAVLLLAAAGTGALAQPVPQSAPQALPLPAARVSGCCRARRVRTRIPT